MSNRVCVEKSYQGWAMPATEAVRTSPAVSNVRSVACELALRLRSSESISIARSRARSTRTR